MEIPLQGVPAALDAVVPSALRMMSWASVIRLTASAWAEQNPAELRMGPMEPEELLSVDDAGD